jgi:membrane-associated phospholipid phosphatase
MVYPLRSALWSGTLIAAVITAFLCRYAGFGLSNVSYCIAVLFVIVGLACSGRRSHTSNARDQLAASLEVLLLFTCISMLGAALTYVGMAYSHGLTDAFLDSCDRYVGFDWIAVHNAVMRTAWLRRPLEMAYMSSALMPFIVIGALHFSGLQARMYQFLAVYAAALLITVTIFVFFPAEAAFAFYPETQTALPANAAHYGAAISGLRDGSLRTIDLLNLGGIVTFPSFHAAMAIIFAWAAFPSRHFRIPVAVINALMWVSAVPIGGHYVVDLLGGSVIATLSIAAFMYNQRIAAIVRSAARRSEFPAFVRTP